MRVGFVGTGTMGSGMAGCLIGAGQDVVVYNRTRKKVEPLVAQGATAAEEIADLADCEVVFTMVSDDSASAQVLFEDRLLDTMGRGAIHIEGSTISVAHAERLAAAHAERDHGFISAPVSGRGDAAKAGTLFIMAAGKRGIFDRCRPLFDAIGQATYYFGEKPAAANAVKLAINAMIGGTIGLLAETYTMIERWGVSKADFHEFVAAGILGSPVVNIYGGMIAEERYKPANFPVPLGLKDIRLALAAAEASESAMPIASAIRDELIQALAQGYADCDWGVLGQVAANNLTRRPG